MTTYRIERFYRDDKPTEIIATGYSLEDAQAWCQREDSHSDGWFDGYRSEDEGYRVCNNVTGRAASVTYDTAEKAIMVCRVLNEPAGIGGLYGVYTVSGVRVP